MKKFNFMKNSSNYYIIDTSLLNIIEFNRFFYENIYKNVSNQIPYN